MTEQKEKEQKLDYKLIILRQLDRCNSANSEDLYEATLKLHMLVKPYSDDTYNKEFDEIQKTLEKETHFEVMEEDNAPYHMAGLDILSAVASLFVRNAEFVVIAERRQSTNLKKVL